MRTTIQLLAALLALGCAKKEAITPETSAFAASTPASASATADAVAPVAAHASTVTTASSASEPASAAPAAAAAAAAAASGGLTGTVLETMDSGGYTYLKLKTDGGEKWAAVRATKVSVGQPATVVGAVEMKGFASKTLNRTFDSIWFGELGSAAPPAAAAAALPPGHPPMGSAADQAALQSMASRHAAAASGPSDVKDVKVPKAEGADARTIAELFAKKAELKDKTVTVRGKVVKSNNGIMGKNWLHVRDGSGSEAGKDHDLTITTDGTAAIGDVVVVKGTVHVDRDFGAGYSYPVIVEDATVTK